MNRTVEKDGKNPVQGADLLSGILYPGRRLLNVQVKRHADGNRRDLQDGMYHVFPIEMQKAKEKRSILTTITDFTSTGRFRILCLTSTDLIDPTGISSRTLTTLGSSIIPRFPKSIIEQVVLHPCLSRDFTWRDVPRELKQHSEMRFYSGYEIDDAYQIYGVDAAEGALAVVRPDGYVGVVAELGDVKRVERYLEGCLRTV